MTDKELLKALLNVSVETGSLACLGCGHEHNCSIHGCAILREVAERYTARQKRYDELNDFEQLQCAKLLMDITESERQRVAAVEMIDNINRISFDALHDGPYQDDEEAKIFSRIEALTRRGLQEGGEGKG